MRVHRDVATTARPAVENTSAGLRPYFFLIFAYPFSPYFSINLRFFSAFFARFNARSSSLAYFSPPPAVFSSAAFFPFAFSLFFVSFFFNGFFTSLNPTSGPPAFSGNGFTFERFFVFAAAFFAAVFAAFAAFAAFATFAAAFAAAFVAFPVSCPPPFPPFFPAFSHADSVRLGNFFEPFFPRPPALPSPPLPLSMPLEQQRQQRRRERKASSESLYAVMLGTLRPRYRGMHSSMGIG